MSPGGTMFGKPHRRTSYLTIAILALTLALSSGAAAVAAPLTEKAVKKIAKAQVKKLAPKLSVAKAKDADALGGVPASSYLLKNGVRADGTATSADIPIVASSTHAPILSKTFTAPGDGYVFVVATLTAFKGGAAGGISLVDYALTLDGAPVTTDPGYHSIVTNDTIFQASGAISSVLAVAAGQHTIALTVRDQGTGSTIRGRDLSVIFTPSGSAPVLPY